MILFPRVSSMSRIFFCFSCFVYDSSLFFCGLIFLSGIRERKIVRGKK